MAWRAHVDIGEEALELGPELEDIQEPGVVMRRAHVALAVAGVRRLRDQRVDLTAVAHVHDIPGAVLRAPNKSSERRQSCTKGRDQMFAQGLAAYVSARAGLALEHARHRPLPVDPWLAPVLHTF